MKAIVLVWIVAVVSYFANVVKAVMGFMALDAIVNASEPLIIQTVGIFIPPLGMITGLIVW